MFKFLKNKQNFQSAGIFLVVFAVVYSVFILLFDPSEQNERIELLDNELTELIAQSDQLRKAIDTFEKRQSERADALLEYMELLLTILEQNKELFIVLEQRITSIQDALDNPDLNSTGLTAVQTEITDILQSLKRINETEIAELAESNS